MGVEMAVFSLEQVRKSTLEYFDGDEISTDVFVEKYALRNTKGELLESTPDDMHRRLAKEFARIELKYPNPMGEEEIYELFKGFKYVVPQGSPMSAIGNPYKVQSLSNCFIIPSPYDSIGGIMHTDQEQAQIMKRRGGVGFDITNIRPSGALTSNAAGTTSGIASFMDEYSDTCRRIAQNGRRGALMLTIGMHPEIETFIHLKRDLKRVTGANISLRLSDSFMRAVENDEEYELVWPPPPQQTTIRKAVRAKQIWEKIVDSAWVSAEPGVLFWDAVTREGPADMYTDKGFGSISTNPCAEIPLSASEEGGYDSCRLMLLNLTSYVQDCFLSSAKFDFKKFDFHVQKAQRMMDDIVDLEIEAVDRIIKKIENDEQPARIKRIELETWQSVRKACTKGRRTGLGITGLGDCLAMMGIVYGSEESISTTEEIYRTLAIAAHASSVLLAKERGAFEACEPGRGYGGVHPFMTRLELNSSHETNELYREYGRRNIALTTTAPAGSVSTLTRTSSGIEPVYLLQYKRRRKLMPSELNAGEKADFIDALGDSWKEYDVYHHGLKTWMDATHESDIERSPYWKATSADIDWVASVRLQAVAQKYVEHAISRTVNLPANATREMVSNVYFEAWKLGCKGCTIYRDGCRSGVLISSETSKEEKPEGQPTKIIESHAPKRPKELPCEIHRTKVHGEDWTIIVGLFEGRPYEVFGGLSKFIEIPRKRKNGRLIKNGKVDGISTYNVVIPIGDDDEILIKDVVSTFDNPLFGSVTRMISLSLRHGIPVTYVTEQLVKQESENMQSFSKVIARVLKQYISDGTKVTKVCPQCSGENMSYQEGCVSCANCAWSKCS